MRCVLPLLHILWYSGSPTHQTRSCERLDPFFSLIFSQTRFFPAAVFSRPPGPSRRLTPSGSNPPHSDSLTTRRYHPPTPAPHLFLCGVHLAFRVPFLCILLGIALEVRPFPPDAHGPTPPNSAKRFFTFFLFYSFVDFRSVPSPLFNFFPPFPPISSAVASPALLIPGGPDIRGAFLLA